MATLAEASLTAAERRALERAVAALERELGGDLVAVWLYGSRARGERPHEDSDIDLLVVVSDRHGLRDRVSRILCEAAVDGFESSFSIQVTDPRGLAEQAAIDSLYLREVERDRVVLMGGEATPLAALDSHELPPMLGPGGVMTRSLRWLDKARRYLETAERSLDGGLDSGVIASTTYYAMLYAARAALSEESSVPRKHAGTWLLMRELFVDTDRLDVALVARAQQMQRDREGADYEGWTFERHESEGHVADARRFVEAVERLIGARP